MGGAGRGQGRKPKADEQRVRTLSVGAIVAHYGSEEEGFAALLNTKEPVLVKWVFEHAYGKPKERVEHSGAVDVPQILFIKAEDCEPIESSN